MPSAAGVQPDNRQTTTRLLGAAELLHGSPPPDFHPAAVRRLISVRPSSDHHPDADCCWTSSQDQPLLVLYRATNYDSSDLPHQTTIFLTQSPADYDPSDLRCLLLSFQPPSPDNDFSDPNLLPSTVLPTSISSNSLFEPLSSADYGPSDLRRLLRSFQPPTLDNSLSNPDLLPTTILPTSSTDNYLSDPCLLPTTILPTSVA
ncbi:hypothetical protein MA16_Dca011440 [Dendrobium catenatum]|uniref:Uncharacterized protein n=1 Tax=Dendrobium catenatum TaxID=906689 RepID=A0A2I0WK92_9ASPA|nr:hypothetical protein MA16_Dca011440 [Dendrobium catenatum]